MKLTVTELYGLCTVRSQKGIRENMTQREHYGLSFCTEGTIVYTQNGKNTVSDRRTAVLLPKGGS
ncbi:MAG: hypothetical protein MJ078_05240 [Clostridia bacterium]|nr:hypothetical protein [Clostridia bacterium]